MEKTNKELAVDLYCAYATIYASLLTRADCQPNQPSADDVMSMVKEFKNKLDLIDNY